MIGVETITGPAIWKGDRSGWCSLPAPNRHHDVIRFMTRVGCGKPFGEQGFVTSTGRFVDRQTAVGIARAAGQLMGALTVPGRLFTEDLW